MRFLHLLPTFDAGGLGSLALELLRAWPGGHQHTVLASRYPQTRPSLRGAFERLAGSEHVKDIPRTMMHPMSFVDSLRDTARVHGPFSGAIIYNFFDHVWYAMGLTRSGFTGPLLCHVGTVLPDNDVTRRMLASPFTKSVRFIPASAAVADALAVLGVEPARVMPTTWNGVDLHAFPAKSPLTPHGITWFGFTGRMAPEAKDFELLLRSYARLVGEAREAARLVLAGDGPKRDELVKLCTTLGLDPVMSSDGQWRPTPAGGVLFLGEVARADVPEFLSALDVFVMAALPIEGMSMALVEALVVGLPVIATDVPSNREVLREVGAGHLVSGDEAMTLAIEWLAVDATARALYAARSRAARSRFDSKTTASVYFELLTA